MHIPVWRLAIYGTLMLLIIFISINSPRVGTSDKIIVEINKKDCEVILSDDKKVFAILSGDKKKCNLYLIMNEGK